MYHLGTLDTAQTPLAISAPALPSQGLAGSDRGALCHCHITKAADAAMDSSPTSLFESYEQDYKQIIASIRGKLDGEANTQKGGEQFITLLRCSLS